MLSLTGVFIWTIIILIIGLFLGWICGSSVEHQKKKNNCHFKGHKYYIQRWGDEWQQVGKAIYDAWDGEKKETDVYTIEMD